MKYEPTSPNFLNTTKATFYYHRGKKEDTKDTERRMVYV
jgi:hypothetical protein